MNSECEEVRDRLTSRRAAGLERHLDDCRECRLYAERLESARGYFKAHIAEVEPDAGFAARVAQRLNGGRPVATLGWAAWRLLPASLVLALVLAWFALQVGPPHAQASDQPAPTEDLVGWLLDEPEGLP